MISAGVQEKLARIEDIRKQIEALEFELEQILGGEPADPVVVDEPMPSGRGKTTGWNPKSKPAADHPYRKGGREVSYDIEGVKKDIRAGMKAGAIAEKYGIKAAVVYTTKSNMKREGDAAEVPREETPAAPASPAMKREPMTGEQFKEVKRLFHEGKKLSSEISKITGIDQEEINVAVQAQAYGMYIFNRKRK